MSLLVNRRREETYTEAKNIVMEKGKVLIIRPTGFGKTGILTRFIRDYTKDLTKKDGCQVMYIFPTQVIKDAVLKFYYHEEGHEGIPNVTFVSYAGLGTMTREKLNKYFRNVKLILADEAHLLAGDKRSIGIKKVLNFLPNAHFVGATATPDRLDGRDILGDYFDYNRVSYYTLHDAIQEGVIQKPVYVWASYTQADKDTELSKEYYEGYKHLNVEERKELDNLLRSKVLEISRLQRLDVIIKDVLEKYARNTTYIRGILFFTSFSDLHDRGDEVVSWFQKAYPNYRVEVTIVSSEKKEYRDNAKKVTFMKRRKNVIDLIFSVNMMNLGYHVPDLTFVGMLRGTVSDIIYAQQLGRVLNSGTTVSGIVFDFVDNLFRKSAFDVLQKLKDPTIKAKERLNELSDKVLEAGGRVPNNIKGLSEDEKDEVIALWHRFNDRTGKGPYVSVNQLLPQDLEATGYEATFKELVAKTVGEPIQHRCHWAWARWVDAGGKTGDGTIDYFFGNAFPQNMPPLGPYCWCYDVSIEEVLKAVFDPDRDIHKEVEEYIRVCKANMK